MGARRAEFGDIYRLQIDATVRRVHRQSQSVIGADGTSEENGDGRKANTAVDTVEARSKRGGGAYLAGVRTPWECPARDENGGTAADRTRGAAAGQSAGERTV